MKPTLPTPAPSPSSSDSHVKWIRPPASGAQCPYSGLSHGSFYNLLSRAGSAIKTASLAQPGAKRAGCRVVFLPDLFAYLARLAEQQQGSGNPPEAGK